MQTQNERILSTSIKKMFILLKIISLQVYISEVSNLDCFDKISLNLLEKIIHSTELQRQNVITSMGYLSTLPQSPSFQNVLV